MGFIFKLNAQETDSLRVDDFSNYNLLINKYSQVKLNEKEEICLELAKLYTNSKELEVDIRSKVLNFYIDTILLRNDDNSSLVSQILLERIRINEMSNIQLNKLIELCGQNFFNLYLIQFIGLTDNEKFISCLKDILKYRKLKPFEKLVIENSLARLGDKEIIGMKLNFIKDKFNKSSTYLDEEFTSELYNTLYISNSFYYDLLFEFVQDDKGKLVNMGDYGDGEIIYCSLSSLSLEMLSKVVIDFPFNKFFCTKEKLSAEKIKMIQDWLKESMGYKYYKWHPYFGITYKYW